MLKLVSKIENLGNRFLLWLGHWILGFLITILPGALKETFIIKRQKIIEKRNSLKLKTLELKSKAKKEITESVEKLKKYDFRKAAGDNLTRIQEKSKTLTPKKLVTKVRYLIVFALVWFWEQIKFIGNKVWSRYGIVGAAAVSIIGVMAIQVNQVATKMGWRGPASIEDFPENIRPAYYKVEEKQLSYTSVVLPIVVRSPASVNSIRYDLTIQTTNRTAWQYLKFNENAARDYLHTQVEAMDPDFSMRDEGIRILKDKLVHELNRFLIKQKVKGRVQEVYLKEIIAG